MEVACNGNKDEESVSLCVTIGNILVPKIPPNIDDSIINISALLGCPYPSLLARPLPPAAAATAGQGPATDTMTAAASQAARRRCRRPLNDALQNSTTCSKQCPASQSSKNKVISAKAVTGGPPFSRFRLFMYIFIVD